MAHTIEPAASGRAKCRGCGEAIPKGELRLGARHPNPFDEETEVTHWFHLDCGAYTRPEPFLEAAAATSGTIPEREVLEREAKLGLEHPRLTRLRGVERARTGRAACRSCREAIPKDTWRIALTYYDESEGRFSPAGFLHVKCVGEYVGTTAIVPRVRRFTPGVEESQIADVITELDDSTE